MESDLLKAIEKVLADMSDAELALFTLAVLHGVPITRLGGDVAGNQDMLIACLKRMRRSLGEAGFDAAQVESALGGASTSRGGDSPPRRPKPPRDRPR